MKEPYMYISKTETRSYPLDNIFNIAILLFFIHFYKLEYLKIAKAFCRRNECDISIDVDSILDTVSRLMKKYNHKNFNIRKTY